MDDFTLELDISEIHRAFDGEAVAQRFYALAEILKREPVRR